MAYKSRQGEIIERLVRIEEHNANNYRMLKTHFDDDKKMFEKIFGNGKPGVIDALETKHDARIAALESTKVWVWGVLVGGGAVVGVLGKVIWSIIWPS